MKLAPTVTKLVKKYGNRRLYDTSSSEYITLDQLAEQVRHGAQVRVVDAATGEDLTHTTFAQILFESRGAARLLSPAVLAQLVRLDQDALAEVFGRYFVAAIDWYLYVKQGYQALAPLNPMFASAEAFARMMSGFSGSHTASRAPTPWPGGAANMITSSGPTSPPRLTSEDGAVTVLSTQTELDALREQIAALKDSVAALHPAAALEHRPGSSTHKSARVISKLPVKIKAK